MVQSGRVLVGSAHGVRALDPVTGEEAWHYTRSNARMCGLTATDGVAVAVFATADRCDEAVALRRRHRRARLDPQRPLRGDATLPPPTAIVLATNPTGIVTLDPTGDNIRWRYAAPAGCRFLGAAAGSAGVAVLQRCAGADGRAGAAVRRVQREAHWSRDVPLTGDAEPRLLGAGPLPTLLADGEVQALASADGAVLALPARVPATSRWASAGALTLVRVGRPAGRARRHRAPLPGRSPHSACRVRRPSRRTPAAPPALLVPEDGAFVRRDPATGGELGRSAAEDLPAGGLATTVGPVVVLRLPDRVLAYR